jgi:hypothetical protein
MWNIAKPGTSAADAFVECLKRMTKTSLRDRLQAAVEEVALAAQRYDAASSLATVHELRASEFKSSSVPDSEFIALYSGRMAAGAGPGRHIYDSIRMAATNGICPLCAAQQVAVLDHHLPKSNFPKLAVCPINLVPCCDRCNKLKRELYPSTAETQTLHPYYDVVDHVRWLVAAVEESSPATIGFSVVSPPSWNEILQSRVQHHFRLFNLGSLYGSLAGSEMAAIKGTLGRVFESAGSIAVREHLLDQADSRAANHCNSWQAALYSGLADSDWYCSGGFRA